MTTPTDPLDRLTIAELDDGNRMLGTDIPTAIHSRAPERWQALAIAAWLLARRHDRAVTLEVFREMTPAQLMGHLGVDMTPAPDPVPAPDPTAGALDRDAAMAALDVLETYQRDVEASAAADPTAPSRV